MLSDPPAYFEGDTGPLSLILNIFTRNVLLIPGGVTVKLSPPECGGGVQSRHVVHGTDGSYVNALMGIPVRTLCPYPGPMRTSILPYVQG